MRRSVNRWEYKVVLECLKTIRKKAKLTQVELAAKLQWSQPYLSSVERGYRRADLLQAVDYCRACGHSFGQLGRMIDDGIERGRAKPKK